MNEVHFTFASLTNLVIHIGGWLISRTRHFAGWHLIVKAIEDRAQSQLSMIGELGRDVGLKPGFRAARSTGMPSGAMRAGFGDSISVHPTATGTPNVLFDHRPSGQLDKMRLRYGEAQVAQASNTCYKMCQEESDRVYGVTKNYGDAAVTFQATAAKQNSLFVTLSQPCGAKTRPSADFTSSRPPGLPPTNLSLLQDALTMAEKAPAARAQTIKQAKAAFKKRGRPSLSEREKKQLERSIELDRRAWRVRESEKRRSEAVKKKAEKDKKDKEASLKAQLGSQRRFDRFGYKSSQMHLGAFLHGNRTASTTTKSHMNLTTEVTADDSFGDSGLDDETLLDALESAKAAQTSEQPSRASPAPEDLDHIRLTTLAVKVPQTTQVQAAPDDLAYFFDELGSSTQIARELTADEPGEKTTTKSLSFSSDDFGLTMDDIEEMESAEKHTKAEQDRKLMPPPSFIPTKATKSSVPAPMSHDFSQEDLECLADYDIQLTQAEPG
ncbi:uncharacterized protein LTR77_008760 [Saxophila tyrrhenica]|uniref:Uncharacterized protein n=1 Tax=Saxophila tyrrhenica TaxID=1690608 RepID=A0AAV9P0Z2_9PEZI|nr:hypothetical protein LTR77_008760 [Saxophila tyrrhenica]